MLGPCPCAISRINDFYRWQIILKGNINYSIANNIKNIVYDLTKEIYSDIRVSLDLNPTSLM
jgi:primosomal protein N' (replication factor Y)